MTNQEKVSSFPKNITIRLGRVLGTLSFLPEYLIYYNPLLTAKVNQLRERHGLEWQALTLKAKLISLKVPRGSIQRLETESGKDLSAIVYIGKAKDILSPSAMRLYLGRFPQGGSAEIYVETDDNSNLDQAKYYIGTDGLKAKKSFTWAEICA